MSDFLRSKIKKTNYIVFLVAFYLTGCNSQSIFSPVPEAIPENYQYTDDEKKIAQAFRNEQSDVIVSSRGVVIRILPDDLKGQRHQRFIVRLSNGQTLLLSHNIDLAPRVDGLIEGARIYFQGEYEWNDRGGVIHWTHYDPQGYRNGGWIDYKGMRYQ